MSDLAELKATSAAIEAAFTANPSPSLGYPGENGWTAHEFEAVLRATGIGCPDCGGPIRVDAVEVTQFGSLVPRYHPGSWQCLARPTGMTA